MERESFSVPEVVLDFEQTGEDRDDCCSDIERAGETETDGELDNPEAEDQIGEVDNGRVVQATQQHTAWAAERFVEEGDEEQKHPNDTGVDTVGERGRDDDRDRGETTQG